MDVGGGVGSVFFPLAEKFPELKLVIQDLPGVIDNAKKVCMILTIFKRSSFEDIFLISDLVRANAICAADWTGQTGG